MFALSKKYKYAASGIAAKFTGTCYTYDKNGNVKNASPYEKVKVLMTWVQTDALNSIKTSQNFGPFISIHKTNYNFSYLDGH